MFILIIGFLIFGPKKLPDIGKSFGETIREFKKSAKDTQDEVNEAIKIEDSQEN